MSLRINALYNTILNVLNICFPLLTVPYISRILDVEDIGLANFAVGYVAYFSLFASLGIQIYGVREIAKVRDCITARNRVFSELFILVFLSTVLVSIFFMSSVFFVDTLQKDQVIIIIAGISLFMTPLSIDWYFQGIENFRSITMRTVIVRLLTLLLLFVFVRSDDDLLPYIVILSVSTVVSNVINLAFAIRLGLKFVRQGLTVFRHIRPMMTLFVSTLAIGVFIMLDTLMLGFIGNYSEVGLYTAATRLVKLVITVLSSVGVVLLPRLSFNMERGDMEGNKTLLQKSFDFSVTFGVPCAFGLCLSSSALVPFFFGPNFIPATLSMQILSLLLIVTMLNNFYGVQMLIGLGYEKCFVRAVLLAALVNFALNLVLIPRYGAVGASVASVIAEAVELMVNIYYIRRLLKLQLSVNSFKNSIISSITFIPLYMIFIYYYENNFLFFMLFIVACCFAYLLMQLLVFKNSILQHFYYKARNSRL